MIQNILYNIKNYFSNENKIFNFSKLKFWNHFFITIFASIIWLCFIAIIGAGLLEKITNPLKFSSKTSMIIEVFPENTTTKTQSKTQIVIDILTKSDYIKSYEVLSKEKMLELTNAFSGNFKDLPTNINLPIIISAELKEYNEGNINQLRALLSQKVKNVYVDLESDVLERLTNPISTAKHFANLIPLIALIILVSILFLIIYSILFSNSETIKTLVLLGIYNKTLASEFARWIFLKSLKSTLIAILLVGLTILGLILLNISINTVPVISYGFFVIVIIFIPIISSIIGILFVNLIINRFFR